MIIISYCAYIVLFFLFPVSNYVSRIVSFVNYTHFAYQILYCLPFLDHFPYLVSGFSLPGPFLNRSLLVFKICLTHPCCTVHTIITTRKYCGWLQHLAKSFYCPFNAVFGPIRDFFRSLVHWTLNILSQCPNQPQPKPLSNSEKEWYFFKHRRTRNSI